MLTSTTVTVFHILSLIASVWSGSVVLQGDLEVDEEFEEMNAEALEEGSLLVVCFCLLLLFVVICCCCCCFCIGLSPEVNTH